MIMRKKPAPRRPSLIGTVARTAVISATATSVSNKVSAKQQAKAGQAPADMPAEAPPALAASPPPAPAAEAGGMTEDKLAMLKNLGELKSEGLLTEAEFAAEKAKLLS